MLCGFLSILACLNAKFTCSGNLPASYEQYRLAVYYILGACIFDLFDGRVARASRRESLFGAEFDSIADTVSFGLAPSLMLYFIVLEPTQNQNPTPIANFWHDFSWVFAFVYLLCVGIRLARFNVLTNPLVPGNEKKPASSDFIGLPCPTAAGMIASIVLFLTKSDTTVITPEKLRYITTLFLPITLLISYLMISTIRYPSFKQINWNSRTKIMAFIGIFWFIVFSINYYQYSIPLIFITFILYGIFYSFRKKRLAKQAAVANEKQWDEEEELE